MVSDAFTVHACHSRETMLQVPFEGNLSADTVRFTLRDEAHPTLPDAEATVARRLPAA